MQDALRKAVDRAAAAESKPKEASCGGHLPTALTDARAKYWEQRTHAHDMTAGICGGHQTQATALWARTQTGKATTDTLRRAECRGWGARPRKEKVQSCETPLCGVCRRDAARGTSTLMRKYKTCVCTMPYACGMQVAPQHLIVLNATCAPTII